VPGAGARVPGEGGSELLGHSQIDITLDLYLHVTVAAVAQKRVRQVVGVAVRCCRVVGRAVCMIVLLVLHAAA